MRKYLIILASLCLFVGLIGLLSSCDQTQEEPPEPPEQEHVHSFTNEVYDVTFLCEAATCTTKAQYYKSCTCGEKGTETFEYGEKLGHKIQDTRCINCGLSGTDGLLYQLNETEDGYCVVGYGDCIDELIIVPSTYESLPVIEIADNAFNYCSTLQEIVLGANIKRIGESAFSECHALKRITLSEGLQEIGCQAFYFCEAIEYVNYLGSLDSWVKIIFYSRPFQGYFSNPTRYAKDLHINGELVTSVNIMTASSISGLAFYKCKSIETVSFSNALEEIGIYAFANCTSINRIVFPDSLHTISVRAFEGCTALTTVEFGDGLLSIGDYAFRDCDSLGEVLISDNVNEIRYGAFESCQNLQKITIPESVTSIGYSAFYDCPQLQDIVYNAVWCEDCDYNIPVFGGSGKLGTTITIGNTVERIPACLFGSLGDNVKHIFFEASSSCKEIASGAFSSLGGLTDLELPDSLIIIGDYALSRCTSLETLNLGNNVTSIGEGAFKNCSALKTIEFPQSLQMIGDYAFSSCSQIQSIVLGDNVQLIGEGAFSNCACVKTISLGENIEDIGDEAFAGCSLVTMLTYSIVDLPDRINEDDIFGGLGFDGTGVTVVFDESVVRIPAYLFDTGTSNWKRPNVTKIVIGTNVQSIGAGAFYDCVELVTVEFNSRNCAGAGVFNKSTEGKGIRTVLIGREVEIIPSSLFSDIETLSVVDFADGAVCRIISQEAFSNCISLKQVRLPDSVEVIETGAFWDCKGLEEIFIGSGIMRIMGDAFYGCTGLKKLDITDLVAWCRVVFEKNNSYEEKYSNPLVYAKALYIKGELVTELIIPDEVSSINNAAFINCVHIQTITFHSDIEKIGDAFVGCTSLQKIVYNGSESQWVNIVPRPSFSDIELVFLDN